MATDRAEYGEYGRRRRNSSLPDATLELAKNLYPYPIHFKVSEDLVKFRNAADYISAGLSESLMLMSCLL